MEAFVWGAAGLGSDVPVRVDVVIRFLGGVRRYLKVEVLLMHSSQTHPRNTQAVGGDADLTPLATCRMSVETSTFLTRDGILRGAPKFGALRSGLLPWVRAYSHHDPSFHAYKSLDLRHFQGLVACRGVVFSLVETLRLFEERSCGRAHE